MLTNEEGTEKRDRSDLPEEVVNFTNTLDEKVHEAIEEMGPGLLRRDDAADYMATAMIFFMSDILETLKGTMKKGSGPEMLLAEGNKRMMIGYIPFLLNVVMGLVNKEKECKETDDCADCPYISVCRTHMDKHPEDVKLGTPENWDSVKERIGRMF